MFFVTKEGPDTTYYKRFFLKTFDQIYYDNYKSIFGVSIKMVGDNDIAADIVQEVFISLFNNINSRHLIHHPKSWLYRTTYNKCIDYFRKQKRFQRIESLSEYQTEEKIEEERDLSDFINYAISKLKPQERIRTVLFAMNTT